MSNKEDAKFEKYTPKSWFKSAVLGLFIGIAVIVPGISGSTIAILFKLYDKLINAISNLFKAFKSCILFLIPIIIGAIVGFLGGFFTIKELLSLIPFSITCLFAGLMIGSSPTVFEEVKGSKVNTKRIIFFIIGLALPITLSLVSIFCIPNESSTLLDVDWYQYPLCILIGFVVAITQLIPGLSATSFLMSIGYFNRLVSSVSLSFWKEHPLYILIYLCLIIGFLLGLFFISKLISRLFKRNKIDCFWMICGFVISSIIAILINPEIYQIYLSWGKWDNKFLLDILLGITLLIVGLVIGLFLFFYEKKKKTAQI